MQNKLTLSPYLIGRRGADFKPANQSRQMLMESVGIVRKGILMVPFESLFAPVVGFTNRVVRLGEDDDPWKTDDGSETVLIRTKRPADGAVVTGARKGIAIFNADCPSVALVEGDQLAVLHGGFRTFARENRDEHNIIEVAIKHFDPKQTHAWIGHGIGPCCWVPEYDDKPEVLDPRKSRHPELLAASLSRTTEKSPFGAGHVSVDLYRLATGLLMEVGVPKENIVVDARCTCCREADGEPLFWSHTRFKAEKQKVDGRNMSVVWLEP